MNSDYLMTLIAASIVLLAWAVSFTLTKRGVSSRLTRNFIHIISGLWGYLWLFFESRWIALSLTLAIFLGLGFSLLLDRIPFFSNILKPFGLPSKDKEGILLYAFSLVWITFFFWNRQEIGSSLIFALAIGDGLAETVGVQFGRHIFKIGRNQKSLEGSIACFLGIALGVYLGYLISGNLLPSFWLIIFSSLMGALIEAISPHKTDNLTMPLALAIFLFFSA